VNQPESRARTVDSAPESAPVSPIYRHRWWILAVMLAAEIMDLIDATVVNVAGPVLQAELGATPTDLQWVIGGYALTLGAGLILGGRLGDRFGRRTMFLVGLVSFTVASLLCALAFSPESLIAFRLLQGFAAAILLPQGFGLLRAAFPPAEIGKAFAVFGPVFGLAGIAGPIIGGALTEADILGTGWRAVFLVNIPVGIAAIVIAWRLLPRTPGDRGIRIDPLGTLIIAVSSAALVWPLVQGREAGWPAWCFLLIAASIGGFALFALQQRRLVARGGVPLVTPGIFTRRSYTVGLAGIALFFTGMVGLQLVLTLFLQLGQGFSANGAGLSNLPLAIGSAIGGAVSGALLADRLGRSVLQIGALVQAAGAGALWFGLSAATSGAEFSIWPLVPGLLIGGIGTGLVVAALFNVVLAAVADDEVGSASGVLTAVQSIAGATGVALFGSVFFDAALAGDPVGGFQLAIGLQLVLYTVFLAISPLFPVRARPE
jgi:EmrB/QacA subfamily drug resistance transporter